MRKRPPATHKARMTQAWKGTRPTHGFSDYDQYYIDLAMTIHGLLLPYFHLVSQLGKEETEQNRLCIALVSYFEDYISEVDLWTTFRDNCRETIGRDLPFYPLDDYDPDYINVQDIALLIWVWGAAGFTSNVIDPNHPTIITLAQTLYAIMEEYIEEAPATATFDEYFTVEDENDFYAVRNIMVWLSSGSWLYGMMDLRMGFEVELEERWRKIEIDEDVEFKNILTYELTLDYAINDISRMGGMRMPEVAARIIKGNPTIRERLLAMPKRIRGDFKIIEIGEKYHILQGLDSLRKIRVSTDSIDLDRYHGTDVTTSLVRWGDEYWVSGALSKGIKKKKTSSMTGFVTYPIADAEERAEMVSSVAKQESVFLEHFKGRMHVCVDRKEVGEAMKGYYTALELFNAKDKGREPQLDKIPNMSLTNMPPNQQIALFFAPNEGIQFSPVAADLSNYLNGEDKGVFDSGSEAFLGMIENCDLNLVRYLVSHYPVDKLAEAVPFVDFSQDIAAWCWFLNPKGCLKPHPNTSFRNEKQE